MYWVTGIIVGFYVVLFLVSKRKTKGKAPPGIMGFFNPMAVFLYQKAWKYKLPLVTGKQVKKDLTLLHPGKEIPKLQEEYYVKKISLFLMICLLGTLLSCIVSYQAKNELLLFNGRVPRGDYTMEPRELELTTILDSGQEKKFQVEVYPYELSEEEAERLYQEFQERLPNMILSDNPSLSQVNKDLKLEEVFENYPFTLEWKSSHTDAVGSLGNVKEVTEATEVILTAKIGYGELEWQEEIRVTVIPPVLSEEEVLESEIAGLLIESEKNNRGNMEWQLPDVYQGRQLEWKEIAEDNGPVLFMVSLVIAALVFGMSDKDLHDEWKQHREELKREYPDVVQKLLLYMGAGMTVRAAFQKMAPDYAEIQYMCRELQAGVSEVQAYEHFGKRTGVQEYLRLSTLLAQNLKKGNSTLLQRLKEESDKASADRLQNCKKLGEEASTKLLLPMVMLLMVVMLMVIIPTFSSMGM